jgi:hypothetical protein
LFGLRGRNLPSQVLTSLALLMRAALLCVWLVAFQTATYQARCALVGLGAFGVGFAVALERAEGSGSVRGAGARHHRDSRCWPDERPRRPPDLICRPLHIPSDCTAVGFYGAELNYQTETNGIWGDLEAPTLDGKNWPVGASVYSAFEGVSCSDAADCTVVAAPASMTEMGGIWSPTSDLADPSELWTDVS